MFHGSIVALVTPFKNGAVDEKAMGDLIEWHLSSGTDALVPCGCTGEAATLSFEEHCRVVSHAVRVVAGRCPVIAGTGSNNTGEAVLLTRHAAEAGADAALVITPYYNKPTPAGQKKHYLEIAGQSTIPVVLYNVPSRTGLCMLPETVIELSRHPKIAAIKESSGNIDLSSAILSGSDMVVLAGDDSLALPVMAVGGKGVVSVAANIVPEKISRLTSLFLNGDKDEARKLHLELFPLFRALFLETNPIPLKTVLAWMGRIRPEWRLPLCALSAENEKPLRQAAEKAGILS